MKIPLSWMKEYVAIPDAASVDGLVEAFVSVGFEVEGVDIQGSEIVGPLVVGLVLSIEEVTGQKKPIRYVGVDCGESETRYVICGATNFVVGDYVVVSLPGAVLPGGFQIAARETYGYISNGMICSGKELGISSDHSGIIVLASGVAGEDAIELLEINDVIFDVAVNPDRGYALSIRGLSREIAGALSVPYKDPALAVDPQKYNSHMDAVQVVIDDPTAVSVIYLRTISDFDATAKTPVWMQRRIEKCGMRPISLAVDITNYVMLELGQPLHAFDRSKLVGSVHIRRATQEKTITTLDGQLRTLSPENIVVSDDRVALALAGTMGGLDSEVTSDTSGIVIEAARFDPVGIAKNSRHHKLSSEASRRFERSVDPQLATISSARAIDLLIDLGNATYVGTATAGSAEPALAIQFPPGFASQILGITVEPGTVYNTLETVGCQVTLKSEDEWLVQPPTWRSDLVTPTDLVEEVGRLVGLHSIAGRLPIGRSAHILSPAQSRKRGIANFLAHAGYSEVYNYPFVNQEMVDLLGFVGPRAASFRLANPMSDQAPLLRTHLLPGLLDAAKRNISRGAKDVAIFELGTVFRDITKLPDVGTVGIHERPSPEAIDRIYASVPPQPLFVGAVVAGSLDRAGWWGTGRTFDWSDSINQALSIIELTGNVSTIVQSDFAPWHPGRCAELQVAGKAVAHAGELHPRVLEALGLPARTCAFAVNLSELPFQVNKSAPLIVTMPAATQDVSLIVDVNTPASHVEAALITGAGELLESIELFDRYESLSGDDTGKISLAFTLTFRASDRTLTADEVTGYREAAVAQALKETGAILRA